MGQNNRIDKADPSQYIIPLPGNWDETRPIKGGKKCFQFRYVWKAKTGFLLT